MTGKSNLVREYKEAKRRSVALVDMSPTELAGYYLSVYYGNPLEALNLDIESLIVSGTKGNAARIILKSVMLAE